MVIIKPKIILKNYANCNQIKRVDMNLQMAVTCTLMGGLGNQMFQVATTYAFALDNEYEAIYPLQCMQNQTRTKDYTNSVLRKIHRGVATSKKFQMYKEPSHIYQKIKPTCEGMYLHGYFQSFKYFDHHRNTILKLFEPTAEIISYINEKYTIENALSVHVRRGDYTKLQDIHYNIPISYYKRALKLFDCNLKMFVFSDDIEWCRSQPIFSNAIFVEEQEDVTLYMMSMCSHHIIANSTFSWWGAYMSESNKVIYPSIWFGKKGPTKNLDDLAPSSKWIMVDAKC